MKKIIVLIFIVSIISGCGIFSSPGNAYKQITEYANKKNYGAVYDSMDGYSKGQVDISMKMLMSFASAFSDDKTRDELERYTGRDLFIRMAENAAVNAGDFVSKPDYKIIKTVQKGNTAMLDIKNADGTIQKVSMVLENKAWKLHFENEEQGEKVPSSVKKKPTLAEKIEMAKQEKLTREAREKEATAKAQLKQVVTVALVDKSFVEKDIMAGRYNDYITIKIALQNNTDKDIKAIKGILIFKDVFGDTIHSVGFKDDGGIKAQSKNTWEGSIEYSQFEDSHKRLRSTELKNTILGWEPQTILFEDGSKLGE